MKIIALGVVLVIGLTVSFEAHAQATKDLGKGMEASLKAKNKKRKLGDTVWDGFSYGQRWSVNGKEVEVRVFEFASPQEASRTLEESLRSVAAADVLERPHGYGDEAFLVRDARGASTSLHFRRGKRYVTIYGNLNLVKEFARDIAEYVAHN